MPIEKRSLTGIAAVIGLLYAGSAAAFNFGNMMNPGRWFDNDRDYYDDYYGPPGGGYGYGYPGYGGGYPGAWGPGWGGAPGYGAPGSYPGTATTLPAEPAKPSSQPTTSSHDQSEVERLRSRVRELEKSQQQAPVWGGNSGGYQYPPSDATYDNPPAYQQSAPGWGGSYPDQTGGYNAQPGFGSQPGYQQGYQPQGGAPAYPQTQAPAGGGYAPSTSYPGSTYGPTGGSAPSYGGQHGYGGGGAGGGGGGGGGSPSQYRTP